MQLCPEHSKRYLICKTPLLGRQRRMSLARQWTGSQQCILCDSVRNVRQVATLQLALQLSMLQQVDQSHRAYCSVSDVRHWRKRSGSMLSQTRRCLLIVNSQKHDSNCVSQMQTPMHGVIRKYGQCALKWSDLMPLHNGQSRKLTSNGRTQDWTAFAAARFHSKPSEVLDVDECTLACAATPDRRSTEQALLPTRAGILLPRRPITAVSMTTPWWRWP